jgi:primase-polymerase (primpol)-like protein
MRSFESPPRPHALPVQVENVPEELKAVPRWIGWQYDLRGHKWDKLPIAIPSERPADIREPWTWSTFEDALHYARRCFLGGIGFVFAKEDDFCGVDIADCRDPARGDLLPFAEELLRRLDSYSEVSPSGSGVKVFLKGKPREHWCQGAGGITVYSWLHYFTVTGAHVTGTPTTVMDRRAAVLKLYHQLDRQFTEEEPREAVGEGLSDDQVIVRATEAKNGEKFARLMAGDTFGYASASEADFALCSMLAFWVGPEHDRVERLFNRSELAMRPKWRRRADYREKTINRAIELRANYKGQNATMSTRIIQEIQDIQDMQTKQDMQDTQEETGNVYTSHGLGRAACELLPEELERQAVELAVNLVLGFTRPLA